LLLLRNALRAPRSAASPGKPMGSAGRWRISGLIRTVAGRPPLKTWCRRSKPHIGATACIPV